MDYYMLTFRSESAIETSIITDILAAALASIGLASLPESETG